MSKPAAKSPPVAPPAQPSSSDQGSSWFAKLPSLYEFGKIAGFTLIPYGVSILGWYVIAPDSLNSRTKWLEKVNRSCFRIVSKPPCVNVLESIIALPMGYALFLVTKEGISSTEVKTAVGAFGGALVFYLGGVYAFSRSKNSKLWIGSSLLIAISAFCTAGAFGKVDRCAGYCMFPYAVWMSHQTVEIILHHLKKSGQ